MRKKARRQNLFMDSQDDTQLDELGNPIKSKEEKDTATRYTVEYAKSDRAMCKGCFKQIEKELLRISKWERSPTFDGEVSNWYHEECFFLRKNFP